MFLTNVAIGNSHPWYVILCHTLVRIQRDSCIDRSWPVISGISAFSSTAYRTTIIIITATQYRDIEKTWYRDTTLFRLTTLYRPRPSLRLKALELYTLLNLLNYLQLLSFSMP